MFLQKRSSDRRTVEFVEPVYGGQMFIPVAKVVLAELACAVALSLEQLGDGHVATLEAPAAKAPGRPTLVLPVRKPHWPVMNDERPAVQLCSA